MAENTHDGLSSGWPPGHSRSSTTDSSSGHTEQGSGDAGPTPRKRRVPDGITPNACTNCKKARAKCDGDRPACGRCTARKVNSSCHYEMHSKTAKEQMMREVQRLSREKEDLEEERGSLIEENSWIESIMSSLKDDSQSLEILHRLKTGEPHKSIAEWLGRPFVQEDVSPTTERNLSDAIGRYHQDFVDKKDPRYWTSVTTDVPLIEHLLTMYLTWIHPVHLLFDESYFLSSLRACTDTYCSAALVNAICAMSCHLLYKSWDDQETAKRTLVSLKASFMNETRVLLRATDSSKITTIQTYAIMFLIEISDGDALLGAAHLRMASEALSGKGAAEQSDEAMELTTCGIVTLQTSWSGLTYIKPSAPVSPSAVPFYGVVFDQDGHWQRRKPSDNEAPRDRPNYTVLTASELSKLYRVIHENIIRYCGNNGRVSSRDVIMLYQRYTTWKEQLPRQITQVFDDPQTLPHALALHIHYHTAITHLFRPLLSLNDSTPQSTAIIKHLFIKHAKEGLALLIQYRRMYSTFYQSPLQLFCLVHICDAIVFYSDGPEHAVDVIRFCLESLEDAKFGYPVAGALQRMFANVLLEHKIQIPPDLEHKIGPPHLYQLEDLLNACSRTSYRPPVSQLIMNFEPNLAQNFTLDWRLINTHKERSFSEGSAAMSGSIQSFRSMDINTLMND